jgi:hypothetical protein
MPYHVDILKYGSWVSYQELPNAINPKYSSVTTYKFYMGLFNVLHSLLGNECPKNELISLHMLLR